MTIRDCARIYRALLRIRRVEEETARLYPTDAIKSPIHLSIGQEATAVGLCEALRPDDVVFGTYRGHALYLAKGGNLTALVAELFGKVTGCAKGKGGSMHLVEPAVHFMGTSAVVATTIPHAIGYAYAMKLRGEKRLAAVQFGDGSVEEGVFHESLNFAALHELPVLFFCENNYYAIHTHIEKRQSWSKIAEFVRNYGIPSERIEDGNLAEIRAASIRAAERIRAGAGPQFIEAVVYRWREHVGPNEDWGLGYRGKEEAEPWIARDPVRAAAERLSEETRSKIASEVEAEVAEAFRRAEADPFPPDGDLLTDLYE